MPSRGGSHNRGRGFTCGDSFGADYEADKNFPSPPTGRREWDQWVQNEGEQCRGLHPGEGLAADGEWGDLPATNGHITEDNLNSKDLWETFVE